MTTIPGADDMVVIRSGQWHLWWRRAPGSTGGAGYTDAIESAGRWTRAEAEHQISGAGPEKRLEIQEAPRG